MNDISFSKSLLGLRILLILFIFQLVVLNVVAQDKQTINGTIKNEAGENLIGANIIIKGTSVGTITDINGQFSLEIEGRTDTLVFSYIGYLPVEVPLENHTTFDIVLSEDLMGLEEVVVIGYGAVNKEDLTGSVSVVSSDDYMAQPMTRIQDGLMGRAAGVNVQRVNGAPGGEVKIRIRGANSLNYSNDPLYVVDGFVGGDINSLNPSDIESMNVLKDASATAIYGSRGANGVIIITTKMPKKTDNFNINFETYYSEKKVVNLYDMLNAGEYATLVNQKDVALGREPTFTDSQIAEYKRTGGTDWQNEVLQPGSVQNYEINLSGGTDRVKYYVSGNFADDKGVFINTDWKRYSLRSNVSTKINDWLDFDLKLYGTREEKHNAGNKGFYGPLSIACMWSPTYPVYTDGDYSIDTAVIGTVLWNPVWDAMEQNAYTYTNTFLSSASVNLKLAKGLTFNIMGNANLRSANQNTFNRNQPGADISTATAYINDTYNITWQNTNNLTYTNNFGEHRITAMAVYEQQVTEQRGSNSTGKGFPTLATGFNNLQLAANQSISSFFVKSSLQSFMGRATYGYGSRYMLSATLRRDGTSKFQGDNKYSLFPAFAGTWTISEESFMPDLDWLSRLKLRVGWGETGNQAIPSYTTLQSMNTSSFITTMDGSTLTPGIGPGDPANPSLKWETTTQSNYGLDLSFFEGRINTSFDVYDKLTKDLLLSESLPDFQGGGEVLKNVGKVENKGLEIAISAILITTTNFTWNSSLNINFFKNKVLELYDPEDPDEYIIMDADFIIEEGKSIGSFYGFNFLGLWQIGEEEEAAKYGNVPGDARYEDIDGDYVIDKVPIGNGTPTSTWGWNNSFTFKNFGLNIFIQGNHGNDVWNQGRYSRIAGGSNVLNATSREVLGNIWSVDNQSGTLPGFSSTSVTWRNSSLFVESGAFIRLSNIALSYDLPSDFLKKINIRSLQCYVSASNLLTITDYSGYDPEISSSGNSDIAAGLDAGAYPLSRAITIGFRLGL